MKKVELDIPIYSTEGGFKFEWNNGFEIGVTKQDDSITISANKEGLISLANHLLNLAQDEVPTPYHIHLDQHNSLEENSIELIIEKI